LKGYLLPHFMYSQELCVEALKPHRQKFCIIIILREALKPLPNAATSSKLETLPVDYGWTGLVIFSLRNPHLLEC